jgi:putative MATE family efflux protein
MRVEERSDLTQGVLWKQLLWFCLPIFLQSVFQQVFGVVDAVIVGRGVGKYALGAINSTSYMIRLFLGLFLGFCSGAAIIIGQGLGAGDKERVRRAVHTGVAFSFAGGVAAAAFCVPMTPVFLKIMRVPADMLPYSDIYTRIIFLGFIAVFIYDMGAGFLRAAGDSQTPFYYLIVSLGLNLGLDLLFVLVFRWGVAGAAAATALSQGVSAVLVLRRLCHGSDGLGLVLPEVRFYREELGRMVRLGLPMGINGVLYSVSNIAIQSTVNALGTDVIAAWSISIRIDTVIWSLYDAFSIAASTFAAQNFGAGRFDRVRDGVKSTLAVGAAVILPLCALMYAFARPLSRLFIGEASVIEPTVRICRIMAPYYIFFLFGDVFAATIRGCGEAARPTAITLIGTCGFRLAWVALIHTMGSPTLLNVTAGYPASWAFNSLLMSVYYFFGRWRSRLQPET